MIRIKKSHENRYLLNKQDMHGLAVFDTSSISNVYLCDFVYSDNIVLFELR